MIFFMCSWSLPSVIDLELPVSLVQSILLSLSPIFIWTIRWIFDMNMLNRENLALIVVHRIIAPPGAPLLTLRYPNTNILCERANWWKNGVTCFILTCCASVKDENGNGKHAFEAVVIPAYITLRTLFFLPWLTLTLEITNFTFFHSPTRLSLSSGCPG